jgi:hypothetical protein
MLNHVVAEHDDAKRHCDEAVNQWRAERGPWVAEPAELQTEVGPANDRTASTTLEIRKRTSAEALRATAQELNAHPERYTVPMVSLLLYALAEVMDDSRMVRCGHSSFWFADAVCMVCGPTPESATRESGV